MNIKVAPVEITEDEPFLNDKLNRKVEIENLTELLINIDSPVVLSLNAPWGMGKTTFIKLWNAYLKEKGIISICFSAWENDFAADPLIAFLGEMNSSFEKYLNLTGQRKKIWEKTKGIGIHIVKRSIPTIVKLGTSGILDMDKFIETEVSKIPEKIAQEAIELYNNTKKSIDEFKKNLATVLNTSSENNNPNTIIIFVDELDRCRPTYAIELLERIKHILDIPGINFVLSLDRTQLNHSIKAVYGSGMDSDGYLRRFIDFEYQLKSPDIESYTHYLYDLLKFDSFFQSRKKYSEFSYEWDHLSRVFILLAKAHKFTVREIEQFFTKIKLALLSTRSNNYFYPPLFMFLLITKEKTLTFIVTMSIQLVRLKK
jgi:hypothetical protein